jgi:DNA-binding beta-propeller fold protein YncE
MTFSKLALISTVTATVFLLAGCSQAPTAPRSAPTPVPVQSVLDFTDLNGPYGVAVDTDGNVFVSDIAGGRSGSNRVVELPAGSTTQKVLPFARATVMTDPAGEVWVLDGRQEPSRLVQLAHGADEQTVFPLPDLGKWSAVRAVDDAGNLYGMTDGGVDSGGGCCLPIQVAKVAPGSNTPEVLPFQHMNIVAGMTLDTEGNLYVGDGNGKRVLKLAPGSNSPSVVPFPDLNGVIDIAVDTRGALYVIDARRDRVLKLDPGSDTPKVLPFIGLKRPVSVAVDTLGAVYVVDDGHRRIVKLEGA